MPPHARRLACTVTAAAAARAVWAALHVLTVAAAADSAVAGGLRLLPRGAPVGASGVVSGAAAPLLPVAAVPCSGAHGDLVRTRPVLVVTTQRSGSSWLIEELDARSRERHLLAAAVDR